MSATGSSEPEVDTRRLWWAGPLTVAVALALAQATRLAAFALFDLPRDFPPLTAGGFTFFTVLLVALAVVIFLGIALTSSTPIRTFRRLALIALVLSMVPDLLLPGRVPGATWPAVIVLMVAHVAAWWPTVFILTNPSLIGRR